MSKKPKQNTDQKPQPAQHTPGPWHVNTLETVLHTVHAVRGCVAEVSRGTMNEVGADEIEANARLIAAAPELIHAVELAYTELSKMGCECDCETLPTHCPLCACKAAIAKATKP